NGDLILEIENIAERAIKVFCPEMSVADRVNQSAADAHAVSALPDRTLQYITNAKFSADLLHVNGAALVDEGRTPRDYKEPTGSAKRHDDLLDHPIGEILLFGIAAQVLER